MEKINMRTCRLGYDMCWLGYAIDALYDIYEDGPLSDPELNWIGRDGERHSLKKGQTELPLNRKKFRSLADTGFYERCTVEGWSDKKHTREVSIVWNPYIDDSHLLVILYGGFPLNDAEDKVIDLIADARPNLKPIK